MRATHTHSTIMKLIDMTDHHIVDSGHTWVFDKKPCKKEMLPILEQNEGQICP